MAWPFGIIFCSCLRAEVWGVSEKHVAYVYAFLFFVRAIISPYCYFIYACVLVGLGCEGKGIDMNGWEVGMQDDVLLLLCGLFWRRGMGHLNLSGPQCFT